MTDAELAVIEARHHPMRAQPYGPECSECHTDWPCDVVVLLAEVRRLGAEYDYLRARLDHAILCV